MRNYSADSCDQVYRRVAADLDKDGRKQSSRTQETKELPHVSFSIAYPRDRIVFSRPINPAFAVVEVLWMLAGRRDEGYLHFWNPRMSHWTNDEGDLCGYGYRLRSHFGMDQLRRAAEALRVHEDSRQVILQIWDPREDLPNPDPRAKDIPCNVTGHLLLRDGSLDWLQVMRSNDIIWGTPYNFIQFTALQEIIAGWLSADVGTYTHVCSSLHVYRRHWEHIKGIRDAKPKPQARPLDLRLPRSEWQEIEEDLIDIPPKISENAEPAPIDRVLEEHANLPKPYRQWTALLAAEALRREGYLDEAWEIIRDAGGYWGESWQRWAKHKEENPSVEGSESEASIS